MRTIIGKYSRRALLTALVAFASLASVHFADVARAAERVKLIDDWKFIEGDGDEPSWRLTWRHIERGAFATRTQLLPPAQRKNPGVRVGFSVERIRPDYDDSAWTTVDLPHDAAISQPFSYANDPTQALLPCFRPLWYRKTFELPASDAGKTISLDFDGVMSHSAVWINGNFAGGWGYGYSSFRIDATPFVKFGESNVVVVRTANIPQSSRWYTGNGIYRNVWLTKSNAVRVARWGVFVKTPEVSAEKATLDVSVDVERAVDANKDAAPIEATVAVAIYRRDASGAKIGDPIARLPEQTIEVKSGEQTTARFESFSLAEPPIWSPETPNTCLAETTVSVGGEVVDVEETFFGIRTIEYDPDRGLLVNGQLTELRGLCVHHDFGGLGAAYNEQAETRRFLALKSIGCNAIRLSHNPSAPETVDRLARLGFLVMAEAFDHWTEPEPGAWWAAGYLDLFNEWSEADIRSLVRRDRNCPAIIMWSIGNEIPELTNEAKYVEIAKRLVALVHEEDPTRPTTSACNRAQSGYGEIPKVLDVFGYNYFGRANYAKFHEQNPTVPVVGSEVVCTASSRNWYVFPAYKWTGRMSDGMSDFHQSSYGLYAFGFNPERAESCWACPPDYEFEAQDRNPFVCGAFAWTGIDYLGAPFSVIEDLACNQVFTDPELQKQVEADKAKYGAYRVPLRICETGAFDSAVFPKDLAYLYKSRWLPEEKTTWILPHWNFPDRVGEVTPVQVFTSGDTVELFLNDKSLGKKTKGEYQYRLTWDDVRYEPGVLRAVSYKNGEVWDEAIVETTGAPAALRLTPESERLVGDGRDQAFIRLEVVDAEGRVVPNAAIDVNLEIEGAGTLASFDTGNATDLTPYASPSRRTFGGLASIVLRSARVATGSLRLTARAEGLESATVELQVE